MRSDFVTIVTAAYLSDDDALVQFGKLRQEGFKRPRRYEPPLLPVDPTQMLKQGMERQAFLAGRFGIAHLLGNALQEAMRRRVDAGPRGGDQRCRGRSMC